MKRENIENIQNLIIESQKLDDAGYTQESIDILNKIKQVFSSDQMVKTSKTPFFSSKFWDNALKETLGQLPKKNIISQWADSTPGLQLIQKIANTSDINKIQQLTQHLGNIQDQDIARLAATQNPIEVINIFKRMKFSPEQLGINATELSPLSRLTIGGAELAAGKSAIDTINTNKQKTKDAKNIEIHPFSQEIIN